jgi:uncharacterized membrane protein
MNVYVYNSSLLLLEHIYILYLNDNLVWKVQCQTKWYVTQKDISDEL